MFAHRLALLVWATSIYHLLRGFNSSSTCVFPPLHTNTGLQRKGILTKHCFLLIISSGRIKTLYNTKACSILVRSKNVRKQGLLEIEHAMVYLTSLFVTSPG